MKLRKPKSAVLEAKDKFARCRESSPPPADLTRLGELAIELLNDRNLEVSKVRPFFWSLVETYVDRFHLYPFDINKALFSYLELNEYPEQKVRQLVEQLESQFERVHGRPLRDSAQRRSRPDALDDEMDALRDSLKYAAMVAEEAAGD